jgi:hypothetical protein
VSNDQYDYQYQYEDEQDYFERKTCLGFDAFHIHTQIEPYYQNNDEQQCDQHGIQHRRAFFILQLYI